MDQSQNVAPSRPQKRFENKPFATVQLTSLAYETIQREMAEVREENRLLKTELADLKYAMMTGKANKDAEVR